MKNSNKKFAIGMVVMRFECTILGFVDHKINPTKDV